MKFNLSLSEARRSKGDGNFWEGQKEREGLGDFDPKESTRLAEHNTWKVSIDTPRIGDAVFRPTSQVLPFITVHGTLCKYFRGYIRKI